MIPKWRLVHSRAVLLSLAMAGVICIFWYSTQLSKTKQIVSLKVKPLSVKFPLLDPNGIALRNAQEAYTRFNSLPSVAIIGAGGFIGSRLLQHLTKTLQLSNAQGYDRETRNLDLPIKLMRSSDIPTHEIQQYAIVVYLGGLTGRVDCDKYKHRVREENVEDILALAKRMNATQLLIFASTSALAEGSGSKPHKETDPLQSQLFDAYTTSLMEREQALHELTMSKPGSPKMIGLRFGTVIGVSPSQRLEMLHMALVRNAFLKGRLQVSNPQTSRAILWIDDLVNAFATIFHEHQTKSASMFNIFNLQSFQTTMLAAANEVAFQTGVHVLVKEQSLEKGFSLDSSKFLQMYNFSFRGSQSLAVQQMVSKAPHLCFGRELIEPDHHNDTTMPCVVCGSKKLMMVLDLNKQPLANDFRVTQTDALQCEREPLRLVRCRQCHHTQLSNLVNRHALFSDYSYQSGTSRTLGKYFDWLAAKVESERTDRHNTKPVVIEIACNDGSQLDRFKQIGWKTYGVDPAANLANISRKKGHTIFVGFWGQDDYPELPNGDSVDAIVAQNVFAHVGEPIKFLLGAIKHMGPKTKLYIQTSQCEMFHTGQFDTLYHEHVSFFTANSFRASANSVNLKIINFELTPIHGTSCLVTFQLKQEAEQHGIALATAVQRERDLAMTTDWFYLQYRGRAHAMGQWMHDQLNMLHNQGVELVAYGAAAKGIVLLHFLRDIPGKEYEFSYVIDDAPLKQGTFCPGTAIPVMRTSQLSKHNPAKPLAIVVFAWNFWEEIRENICRELRQAGCQTAVVILPFPEQQLLVLDVSDPENVERNLFHNIYLPPQWMPSRTGPRPLVVMITHFYNEAFMLPFFIQHHAPMFDKVILLDYHSTDNSVAIVRQFAPSSWEVRTSRNQNFLASAVDDEVMAIESEFLGAWRIVLTVTEFFVHENLRSVLSALYSPAVFEIPSLWMVGSDTVPLKPFVPLLTQRFIFGFTGARDPIHRRFLHNTETLRYGGGRHKYDSTSAPNSQVLADAFIAKMVWTPWPESKPRKSQIHQQIPQQDRDQHLGSQHVRPELIERLRVDSLAKFNLQSLYDIEPAKHLVYESGQTVSISTYALLLAVYGQQNDGSIIQKLFPLQ